MIEVIIAGAWMVGATVTGLLVGDSARRVAIVIKQWVDQ